MKKSAISVIIIYVFMVGYLLSAKNNTLAAGNADQKNVLTRQTADTIQRIAVVLGDLDKDGIEEKICVYDTSRESDFGTVRDIYIFKNKKGKWILWHVSSGAVLPSMHGGMMGDPFEGISIEKGCIVINHFGGSRHKWSYTHRYRFQHNSWKLIGATILHGAPCDYWCNIDYNLSTGNIMYNQETDHCEEDDELITADIKEKFKNKPEKLPDMDGFYPGDNELILSEDISFYY